MSIVSITLNIQNFQVFMGTKIPAPDQKRGDTIAAHQQPTRNFIICYTLQLVHETLKTS